MDSLPGGKADDKPDRDFSAWQLAMGTKVESEHTNDPAKAREIARDHLTEIPDYYTRLARMEEAAKAEKRAGALQSMGRAIAGGADDAVLAYLAHRRHEKGQQKLRMHPPRQGGLSVQIHHKGAQDRMAELGLR